MKNYAEVSFSSVVLHYTAFLMKIMHTDLSDVSDTDFIDNLDEYIRKFPPAKMTCTTERDEEIAYICEQIADIWQRSFSRWTIGNVLSNFFGYMLSERNVEPIAIPDRSIVAYFQVFANEYGN